MFYTTVNITVVENNYCRIELCCTMNIFLRIKIKFIFYEMKKNFDMPHDHHWQLNKIKNMTD